MTGCGRLQNSLTITRANLADRPCNVIVLSADNTTVKSYVSDGYVQLDPNTRVFSFRVKGKMVRVMGNAIVEER